MAITQADLDALDAAINAGMGVRVITFTDGQTTQFDSIDDKLKLRAFMVRELAVAAGSPPHYKLAVVKKGT